MASISIQEAQARLTQIIDGLTPGQELVITRNDEPVARLVGERPAARKPRQPGSAKGKLFIHADDKEHLKDFEEYMP